MPALVLRTLVNAYQITVNLKRLRPFQYLEFKLLHHRRIKSKYWLDLKLPSVTSLIIVFSGHIYTE